MIFWIDDIEDVSGDWRPFAEAISNLGEAGYFGRHLVLGGRNVVRRISALDGVSPRSKAYFLRIAEEITQLGHVARLPATIVSAKVNAPILRGKDWHVPMRDFSNPDLLESCNLVCEDINDCDVISLFAENYIRHKYSGLCISLRSVSGGGNGISRQLQRSVDRGQAVSIYVVDSDREVVEGGMGDTAKRCFAIDLRDVWRVALYITEARELENLIPLGLVSRMLANERRQTGKVDNFGLVDRDIANYVCLKTGERLCRFHDVDSSFQGHERTRAALVSTSRNHPGFSRCGEECANCDCDVVPSLRNDFLSRFASWLSQIGNSRLIPSWNDVETELNHLVEIVSMRGLALPRSN